jgi:hypothetical protein
MSAGYTIHALDGISTYKCIAGACPVFRDVGVLCCYDKMPRLQFRRSACHSRTPVQLHSILLHSNPNIFRVSLRLRWRFLVSHGMSACSTVSAFARATTSTSLYIPLILQTLGSLLNLVSFGMLIAKVVRDRHTSSISIKTLQCYALVFTGRLCSILVYEGYLPFDRSGDWFYQACESLALLMVLGLLGAAYVL